MTSLKSQYLLNSTECSKHDDMFKIVNFLLFPNKKNIVGRFSVIMHFQIVLDIYIT